MLRSGLLGGVPHAFTGRAQGDLRRTQAAALAAVSATLGVAGPIRTVSQVHGQRVVDADELDPDVLVEADALVATRPARWIGVRVADCVPVLLCAADGRAVAAVHAGWRGTAADIVRAAVGELRSRVPGAPLRAAVGPSIRGCCYTVGDEVIAGVAAVAPGRTWLDGRRVDLAEANRAILASEGVDVEVVGGCTRCGGRWWSHRAGDAERQLALIAVPG